LVVDFFGGRKDIFDHVIDDPQPAPGLTIR
jgi:hypothetical protein